MTIQDKLDIVKNNVIEDTKPPAVLGRIVSVETVRRSIKNLLCYIENGVASQTRNIGGDPNGQ